MSNERNRLQRHVMDCLESKASQEVADISFAISEYVMEALDSWIEDVHGQQEQGQPEEIKVGDEVELKREVRAGDGSYTNQVCDVSNDMERVSVGDIGTVKVLGTDVLGFDDNIYCVKFDATEDAWWFHVDDLKKVQP